MTSERTTPGVSLALRSAWSVIEHILSLVEDARGHLERASWPTVETTATHRVRWRRGVRYRRLNPQSQAATATSRPDRLW